MANAQGSLPVAYQLYLPQEWASDRARRKRAGVPPGIVLADAAYGTEADWRDQLTAWGLPAPVSVWEVAQQLPAAAFAPLRGVKGRTRRCVPALPHCACGRRTLARARAEEWLLIEWPRTEAKPVHYWLCTLPASTPLKHLVATAMGRWRIERDYQELKSELGLHHYEGRNWRGFHHHASLCIAAYGFLMRERLRSKKNSTRFQTPTIPKGFRPRGSGPNAATRPHLDRNPGVLSRTSDRKRTTECVPAATRQSISGNKLINTVELETTLFRRKRL